MQENVEFLRSLFAGGNCQSHDTDLVSLDPEHEAVKKVTPWGGASRGQCVVPAFQKV